jgi:SAM-dependent methyltransferase
MSLNVQDPGRHWQNWDVDDTAQIIDKYWLDDPSEKKFRKAIASHLKEVCGYDMPIFEVGCGTGLICHELIEQGVVSQDQYRGGDVSQSMLAIARDRLPGVDLIDVDIFDLGRLERQENVICIQVLQHLPHYRQALAQLLQFAKRQLYIVTWFSSSGSDEISMSQDSAAKSLFHTNCYGMDGFISDVRAADRSIASLAAYKVLGNARAIHIVFAQ